MDRVYFIDMRFNVNGHYLDDIRQLKFLSERFNLEYIADVPKESVCDVPSYFTLKEYLFNNIYYKVFILLLLDRSSRKMFLSCSFIPLLIISMCTFNFNFNFRIHSFPTKYKAAYKVVINLLSKISNRTIFLDYPVEEYFIGKKIVNRNKSKVVFRRDLPRVFDFTKRKLGEPLKILFIGALNTEKDLEPILDGLIVKKLDSVRFGFYSKGISYYQQKILSFKQVYEDTVVVDRFLDRVEYDRIISEYDILILPYVRSYGVRFSGVLNDALRNGKRVLAVDLPQFKYYSGYGVCATYKGACDVVSAIEGLLLLSEEVNPKIYSDYSKEMMISQFNDIGF
jgi:glycosyltransferase involved in cell wall biosynthesis